MTYQYKREPLSIEEADRLFSVADTLQEKLCVYGLLETGLRVSELAGLNKQQIQWQQGAIRIKRQGWTLREKIESQGQSPIATTKTALRKLFCAPR